MEDLIHDFFRWLQCFLIPVLVSAFLGIKGMLIIMHGYSVLFAGPLVWKKPEEEEEPRERIEVDHHVVIGERIINDD